MTTCWQICKTKFCIALLVFTSVLAPAQSQTNPTVLSLNLCYDALLAELAPPQQKTIVTRQGAGLGLPVHSGRLEEIIRLAPDIVLANPYNDPLLIQALRQHEVQVTVLPEPTRLDEVNRFWHELADALRQPELAEQQRAELEQLLSSDNPLAGKRVLTLQANHYSFGRHTLVHEVLQRLGAENLAARQGSGLVTVLPEQVLAWQPDLVILSGDSARPDTFALAHRNTLHRALAPFLDEHSVTVSHALSGCMAQNLSQYVETILGAVQP